MFSREKPIQGKRNFLFAFASTVMEEHKMENADNV